MAAMEKAVALDDSCDLTGVLASLPLASALPVGGRSGLTAIVALTTLTVRPQRTIIHLLSTLAVRPQHNCHTSVINIRRLFLTQLSYICYQHSPSVLNTVSEPVINTHSPSSTLYHTPVMNISRPSSTQYYCCTSSFYQRFMSVLR